MGPEREGTWRSSGVGDGRAIGCLEVSPRGIFDPSRGRGCPFSPILYGLSVWLSGGHGILVSEEKKPQTFMCRSRISTSPNHFSEPPRSSPPHYRTESDRTRWIRTGSPVRVPPRRPPRASPRASAPRARPSPSLALVSRDSSRARAAPRQRLAPSPAIRDLTSRPPITCPTVVLTKKKPTGGMNGVPKSAEAVRALPRTLAKFLVSLFRVR